MPTFRVTVEATITKTLTVEAEDVDHAYELAHQQFSVMPEDDEQYTQDVIECEEESEE